MLKSFDFGRISESRELLHVVSGHSVGGTLRASKIADNILVWYDSLTIGPVPQTSSLEEMSQIRHRYMKKHSFVPWLEHDLYAPSLSQRDRMLWRCAEWKEVALWAGPSVMEQFSLLQILAAIAEQENGDTRFSSVVCPKHAMGMYRPEELAEFFPKRSFISRSEIELARRAWRLYCAPDPMGVYRFAKQKSTLKPELRNALVRQLEQFPSTFNGLSVSEHALLGAVEGSSTVSHTVGYVLGHDDEHRTGDQELFEAMAHFLNCKVALIEPKEKAEKIRSALEFRRLAVKLTVAGRDVLAGNADQIALNGIDRWIGGVHLKGKKVLWRWDSETSVLRRFA